MTDPQIGFTDHADKILMFVGGAVKFSAAVLGAVIGLNFIPAGLTLGGRAVYALGGLSCASLLGPAVNEWAQIEGRYQSAGVVFLSGMLGMVVIGELVATIRGLQLAQTIRDAISARLGGGKR